MKRIIFSMLICFASITIFAQSSADVPIQNISMDCGVSYRLFATQNTYTFIKLNTRNGQMWQVRGDIDKNYSVDSILWKPLANESEEKNGRFFLYPITNSHTFILLDQINGRMWQVHWGKEILDRWITPIN